MVAAAVWPLTSHCDETVMAISDLERTHIIKLAIGLLNTIPSDSCIAAMVSTYEDNGHSLLCLARELASSSEFLARNPATQTAAEFATALLTPFGLQHNAIARQSIIEKFEAGISKARIAYEWVAMLDSSSHAAFKSARETLQQRAAL